MTHVTVRSYKHCEVDGAECCYALPVLCRLARFSLHCSIIQGRHRAYMPNIIYERMAEAAMHMVSKFEVMFAS